MASVEHAASLVDESPERVVAGAARATKPATCQMFETPLIERFSRVHPAMPFVFWGPVLAYVAIRPFGTGMGALSYAGLLLGGVLVWTLTEYVLHRYVFHYLGPRLWQ